MDYVQYLQSTRPAVIMTYVHFWTCVMIAAGLVLQDTKLQLHPIKTLSRKEKLRISRKEKLLLNDNQLYSSCFLFFGVKQFMVIGLRNLFGGGEKSAQSTYIFFPFSFIPKVIIYMKNANFYDTPIIINLRLVQGYSKRIQHESKFSIILIFTILLCDDL